MDATQQITTEALLGIIFLIFPISRDHSHSFMSNADLPVEREQLLIDALLLRYRNIVELAVIPEGEALREVAAAQAFQMRVETQALVRAAEDLLKLTRELKEMWLFEPLRGLNEGETEVQAKIDEDAKKVGYMIEALLSMRKNRTA